MGINSGFKGLRMRAAVQPLPSHAFNACSLVKHRGNFTLHFYLQRLRNVEWMTRWLWWYGMSGYYIIDSTRETTWDVLIMCEICWYISIYVQFFDALRAGRSGDRIPVGARFFASSQTGRGAHSASCTVVTGSLCRG